MRQKACELVSGLFVKLPVHLAGEHKCDAFQGPVLVELNADVPGSVLIQYPGGTYECEGASELDVLPRPVLDLNEVPFLAIALSPIQLLVRCSDALVVAGWPALAREQFVEIANSGGREHMIRTIHDVFDSPRGPRHVSHAA